MTHFIKRCPYRLCDGTLGRPADLSRWFSFTKPVLQKPTGTEEDCMSPRAGEHVSDLFIITASMCLPSSRHRDVWTGQRAALPHLLPRRHHLLRRSRDDRHFFQKCNIGVKAVFVPAGGWKHPGPVNTETPIWNTFILLYFLKSSLFPVSSDIFNHITYKLFIAPLMMTSYRRSVPGRWHESFCLFYIIVKLYPQRNKRSEGS